MQTGATHGVPIYEEILPKTDAMSKIRLTPCEAYAVAKETSTAASNITQEYEEMNVDLTMCVAYGNPKDL